MCGSISPREREMMRLEYEQMLARQAEEAEREIEMTRELIDEPLPEKTAARVEEVPVASQRPAKRVARVMERV